MNGPQMLKYNGIMSKDLTSILRDWPEEEIEVDARLINGVDGKPLLQLRVSLGLLQMRLDGTPEGRSDDHTDGIVKELTAQFDQNGAMEVSEERWDELDREIMRYYHRRVALLSVAGQAQMENNNELAITCYDRAVRDADHNLEILDFLTEHGPDPEFQEDHEQYRSFVLLHKTLARVQRLVLSNRHESAVEEVGAGIERIQEAYVKRGSPELAEFDTCLLQLHELGKKIRQQFGIEQTLREQLQEAIEREDFERAAKLRDQIATDR